MGFDRYSQVRRENSIGIMPYVEIPVKNTDYYEKYIKGETRMDILSYNYYGSCDYGWLILQANPKYGSLEFNIPDGVELRIPFPLDTTLNEYQKSIEKYKKYYK